MGGLDRCPCTDELWDRGDCLSAALRHLVIGFLVRREGRSLCYRQGHRPSPSPYSPGCVEGDFSELASRGVYALCSGSEREERTESMQNFLDGLVRSTKTVMTRVELGGTLFLVAVIGVLLTSREEGDNSSS